MTMNFTKATDTEVGIGDFNDRTFLGTAFVAASLLLTIFLATWRKPIPKGYRRPPGPKGWPIVGNTLQIGAHPQALLKKWAKEYGEIYTIHLAGYDWVCLNTPDAVKAVMDKQSAATSSRTPAPVFTDQISGGMRTILMPYDAKWRTLRSIIHKLTTPKASDMMRPSQDFEAKQLIYELLVNNEDDKKFYTHCRRYSSSVIMTSTYGKRIPSWDGNDDVKEIYSIMSDLSRESTPRGSIGDHFPILTRILPMWLQPWAKKSRKLYLKQERLWLRLYNELKSEMDKGIAPECFVKQLIEKDFKELGIDELQAAFVAGSMIEAGSETTAGAMNIAIKYLAANPRVQDVANEYITQHIGDDRSPTYDDFDTLLYIRAIASETIRHRPVGAVGVAHFSTADVCYKDYFIPKGTVVNPVQTVLHTGDHVDSPDEFMPERYMKRNRRVGPASVAPDPSERDHFGWGVGRRICPGMHVAENSLFITIAKILWAFEIRPPLDENGNEEELDLSDEAFEDGNVVVARPYRVRFLPRNETRARVLVEEWETARREGYILGNARVDERGMLSKA